MTENIPITAIKNVQEVFNLTNLTIPEYQRPYKWMTDNVGKLLSDIKTHISEIKATHRENYKYRLGTLVLHADKGNLDIVDGQQRIITLLLLLKVLGQAVSLKDFVFSNPISQQNIKANYQYLERELKQGKGGLKEFILQHCEFVVVTLNSVSEAFQFFDSQNARGKDLAPHDLLKAYHLREFIDDEQSKKEAVKKWEDINTDDLNLLFADYLYRIRRWIYGLQNHSQYFNKANIDTFKGIKLSDIKEYPYSEHFGVQQQQKYQFQLDQVIINGKCFFEMIEYYHSLKQEVTNRCIEQRVNKKELSKNATLIFEKLDNYEGRWRIGDGYVRTLFNCILMNYINKFGYHQLSLAIEKSFIWAYSIRLNSFRVSFPTVDKAVFENNLFLYLKVAVYPRDFLNIPLPPVKDVKASKVENIKAIFEDMGYIHNDNK